MDVQQHLHILQIATCRLPGFIAGLQLLDGLDLHILPEGIDKILVGRREERILLLNSRQLQSPLPGFPDILDQSLLIMNQIMILPISHLKIFPVVIDGKNSSKPQLIEHFSRMSNFNQLNSFEKINRYSCLQFLNKIWLVEHQRLELIVPAVNWLDCVVVFSQSAW